MALGSSFTIISENTTESQREGHENEIVSIVRLCLVDESAKVRGAAAAAFDILQGSVGETAISQTIPTLLDALKNPGAGSDTALQALKEIMTVRPIPLLHYLEVPMLSFLYQVRASSVFPEIVPTLISTPLTVAKLQALGELVTVAEGALSKRINQILNPLVRCLEDEKGTEIGDAVEETLKSVLRSVSDSEGLNTLMLTFLGW